MQNYKRFGKRQNLHYILPECSCEKCTVLRLQEKYRKNLEFRVRNKSGREVVNSAETSESKNTRASSPENPQKTDKMFTLPRLTIPKCNFTPGDFSSVLCDLVGIASFFFMISIMFWLTVSQYLWSCTKKLFQAGRSIKWLTLALLLLLCAGITYHALTGTHQPKRQLPTDDQPQSSTIIQCMSKHARKNCHHKNCIFHNRKKSSGRVETAINEAKKCDHEMAASNGQSLERKTPSLCDLCAEKFTLETNSQPSLNDEEAREMYKRYKLYSAPSEMKFPPSVGHIFEAFLGLFEYLSNSVNRTFF